MKQPKIYQSVLVQEMEFDCVYYLVVWWCIVVSNTLVCVTALSVINPAVAAAAAAEVFELEIY